MEKYGKVCPPGKYDFTASSKSDCPQRRRNTRLVHSITVYQSPSRVAALYRHIVTLLCHYRGGPLVTGDCFSKQIPASYVSVRIPFPVFRFLPLGSFLGFLFSWLRFLFVSRQKPVLNLRSVHCMQSLCCRPDFAEYEARS